MEMNRHEWKLHVGLVEKFYYCENCDVRRDSDAEYTKCQSAPAEQEEHGIFYPAWDRPVKSAAEILSTQLPAMDTLMDQLAEEQLDAAKLHYTEVPIWYEPPPSIPTDIIDDEEEDVLVELTEEQLNRAGKRQQLILSILDLFPKEYPEEIITKALEELPDETT